MSQKEREEKAKEFWKYYSSDTKFPFYRKQGLKLIENY